MTGVMVCRFSEGEILSTSHSDLSLSSGIHRHTEVLLSRAHFLILFLSHAASPRFRARINQIIDVVFLVKHQYIYSCARRCRRSNCGHAINITYRSNS